MDCREFKKISGGYLEDAVPPEKRQEVEEHLGVCPICSAIVNQMRHMREHLRLAFCKDCCPDNLRRQITRNLRTAEFKRYLDKFIKFLGKM